MILQKKSPSCHYSGNILSMGEDIGRHNAVDPAIGYISIRGKINTRENTTGIIYKKPDKYSETTLKLFPLTNETSAILNSSASSMALRP